MGKESMAHARWAALHRFLKEEARVPEYFIWPAQYVLNIEENIIDVTAEIAISLLELCGINVFDK